MNFVISLTTIPSRVKHPKFKDIIQGLLNQSITPDFILLFVSTQYNRFPDFNTQEFELNLQQLLLLDSKIKIIVTQDLGPIMKVLGASLCTNNTIPKITINHLSQAHKPNILHFYRSAPFILDVDKSIIISCDDDWLYKKNLLQSYSECFSKYPETQCVAIDQSNVQQWKPLIFNLSNKQRYEQCYKGNLYGWLSYAFPLKSTVELLVFYNDSIKKCPDVVFHDDCLISNYVKKNRLVTVALHIDPFEEYWSELDSINSLRNSEYGVNNEFRVNIEKKFQ
jgi:hypothetical protein